MGARIMNICFFIWIFMSFTFVSIAYWFMDLFTSYNLDSQLYSYVCSIIIFICFVIFLRILTKLKEDIDDKV